jgi:hypothetical protein
MRSYRHVYRVWSCLAIGANKCPSGHPTGRQAHWLCSVLYMNMISAQMHHTRTRRHRPGAAGCGQCGDPAAVVLLSRAQHKQLRWLGADGWVGWGEGVGLLALLLNNMPQKVLGFSCGIASAGGPKARQAAPPRKPRWPTAIQAARPSQRPPFYISPRAPNKALKQGLI